MKTIVFRISGMHCTSCAMNIDGELEDTEGIKESETNYAKAQTKVTFDTTKISDKEIISIIKTLEYQAEVMPQ